MASAPSKRHRLGLDNTESVPGIDREQHGHERGDQHHDDDRAFARACPGMPSMG